MISRDLGNITKYIKSKCNHPTTMKVQKLTYISYCWYLTCYNKKLFTDTIFAYKDGPVIEELFKMHKGKKYFTENMVGCNNVDDISLNAKIIIDGVISIYGEKTGDELSDLTHNFDTPWSKTKRNNILEDSVIIAYYTENFPQITMLPIIKDAKKLDLNFNAQSIGNFIKENPTYADRERAYINNNHPSHARLKEVGILL